MYVLLPAHKSAAPGFPTRGLHHALLAPEGAASGSPGAAPAPASPSPSPEGAPTTLSAIPTPPVADKKPTPPVADKKPTPPAPVVDDKPVATAPEEKPKAADPLAAMQARLDALEAELNAARAESSGAAGAVRAQRLGDILTAAALDPRYHRIAIAEIGDASVSTDEGKARIDQVVESIKRTFPEAVLSRGPKLPDSAWVDRLGQRRQASIEDPSKRRPTLLDSLSPADLQSITRRGN